MTYALSFLCGLLFANAIPHFTNGISGREFHTPYLYRFFPWIPSPLFNVMWGLLNLALALACFRESGYAFFQLNLEGGCLTLGFIVSSTGLSLLFRRRSESLEKKQADSPH